MVPVWVYSFFVWRFLVSYLETATQFTVASSPTKTTARMALGATIPFFYFFFLLILTPYWSCCQGASLAEKTYQLNKKDILDPIMNGTCPIPAEMPPLIPRSSYPRREEDGEDDDDDDFEEDDDDQNYDHFDVILSLDKFLKTDVEGADRLCAAAADEPTSVGGSDKKDPDAKFVSVVRGILKLVLCSSSSSSKAKIETAEKLNATLDPNPMNSTQPCLLYTSPSPRDRQKSRMPSSA